MSTQSTIDALDFSVTLPAAVMVRPTCGVEVTEQKLILTYAGRRLTFAGPNTLEGYALTPLAEGRVLTTGDLTLSARRLLASLAARGVLADPDQPGGANSTEGSAGINTIGCFTDEIYRLGQEIPRDTPENQAQFLSGDFAPTYVRAGILAQFQFTNSAVWHISPVLNHDLSDQSRRAWFQYLADETPHYRIWRPALSSFGWDFAKVQQQIPREPMSWLIESFRGAAEHSELAYLGLISKAEVAPLVSHYSESEYYTTWINKYGVPEAAIRPLWWHDTENVVKGHVTMPAMLMASLGQVTSDQLSDAFWYLRRHSVAMYEFHLDLAVSFGGPDAELPDLS